MSDTAVLIEEIQSLPPNLAAEVLDFVGYLKHKSQKEAARAEKLAVLPCNAAEIRRRYLTMSEEERAAEDAREMEIINRNADRLNREMEDVLKDQVDIFDLFPPYEHDL